VSSVPVGVCFVLHPPQHIAILKRPQQLVVAGARFVSAGHDRVHASEGRVRTDALGRGPCARPNAAVSASRVFQRPHDSCANGDHPAAAIPARIDQPCR
jgi:hypothetical protein